MALRLRTALLLQSTRTREKALAATVEAQQQAQHDMSVTKTDLIAAKMALEELGEACAVAAANHEKSVKGRNDELNALAPAKQAILDKMGGAEASPLFWDL